MGFGIHRIADPGCPRDVDEPSDEPVVDRALQEQPRAGDAGLPAGGKNPGDGAHDGGCKIGIVEHDVGRFAAELERDMLDICAPRLR